MYKNRLEKNIQGRIQEHKESPKNGH